ncbi:MAG: aldo/keto reductase, partial [Armatimonadetes bacterium]|nr:aldo/keto reductase [Armatimonadota bacterium]
AEGKGTYGMKVMGQGKLGDDARSAIRYQLSVPVDAFVIGMEDRRQVDENVRLVSELTSDSG